MAKDQNELNGPDKFATTAIESINALSFPWQTRDPFLFCVFHNDPYPKGNDKLGPAASLAGRDIGQDFDPRNGWRMYHGDVVPGFPQHPHRGFETVTIVNQGFVDHSDSLGATARYGAGDVQWLTAGRGIVHAEMFPLVSSDADNPLELFQIWLNLPAKDKMVDPHFTMLWEESIPGREVKDAEDRCTQLKTVAGSYDDIKAPSPPPDSWAAAPETNVSIWTIKMEANATWTLPATKPGVSRTLYFYAGSDLHIGRERIPANHMVALKADVALPLRASSTSAELLLLEGRPIQEPVAHYGPFVMNTRQELQQAFADYQRTQFGGWPWANNAPVHARQEGRFAKHVDGRLEKPV